MHIPYHIICLLLKKTNPQITGLFNIIYSSSPGSGPLSSAFVCAGAVG